MNQAVMNQAAPATLQTERLSDGAIRIILPIKGLYVPVPEGVRNMDILTINVLPVVWILTLIVRASLRMPNPPRVLIEVSDHLTRLTERNPKTGQVHTKEWSSDKIAECRPNQFEAGLWIRVVGIEQTCCLRELKADEISQISAAMREALLTLLGDRSVLKSE